jgi:hypothetical protein
MEQLIVLRSSSPGRRCGPRLPAANATNKAFQTLARKMLEQGRDQQELLAKHGLADKLLDDLAAAVNEFDASVAETNGGKQDHVLARAELDDLSDEVMRLVGMLDGLNRYRSERDRRGWWRGSRRSMW